MVRLVSLSMYLEMFELCNIHVHAFNSSHIFLDVGGEGHSW